MTQFIPTSELDFLNYRESLKAYLKSQAQFQDYDFEGSNFAVLLDVLALNTTLGAYYENMVGSEMFLDTAVMKDSVVSHSKELNYTPRSRSAARTTVTVTVDTEGDSPASVTVPKYYAFTSAGFDANNNSKTYQFVTNTSIVIQPDSFGNYSASNVEIFQGVVVREAYTANSIVRYVLQSNTVDVDTIGVSVVNSNTDNTATAWTRSLDVYGLTSQSNVFFVQGYSDDKYELVFGNGVIGRALSNGNIVNVSYVSTDGEDGNSMSAFTPTVAVQGYRVSSVVSDEGASGGAERETVESIKFHAPRHFTTQERAVIDSDFENLVREKFPIAQSVRAYGGELLSPPQYGRVAIFVKPYGTEGIISDNVKRKIVNYLKGKSITTEAFVVDPEYFYVKVTSTVSYDASKLSMPLEQLRSAVIDAVSTFGEDNLVDFDSDMHYSKFVAAIDDVDPAVVSNDTKLSIIKRWGPATGSVQSLKFSFGSALLNYNATAELDRAIPPTITSSVFSYVVNGISYSAKVEDNGLGVLKVVANNGTKNVLNSNVGRVNYDTGSVDLALNVSSYSSYISLYASPAEKDVNVSENRFLILDTSDVTVTMVAE
jgi:hypothetical protein